MINAGTVLGGRYEVLEKIGTGGMADVYKAKDHKLNRNVAVKVLKDDYSSNKNFVSKFRAEAQAAAGLTHPNIVNVYDVGEENGMYYFVMELVEGITLKNYIEKKIQLTIKEAVSIAIQISMGIEAAHNNGIIHRDIKPQNVIISKDGKVKVADFGIARAATSDTITTHAMGSVHYTSPEQARGGYSDAKSDIYSIGITLFEMITGRVPFDGETTVAIAIKHLQEEMPSPSLYAKDIPISVERIIMKCTQKSPDRRYANMGELIADLKHSLISPNEDFVVIDENKNAATKILESSAVKNKGMSNAEASSVNVSSIRRPQSSFNPANEQYGNNQYTEHKYMESQYIEPKYSEPKYSEPKYSEPKYSEPKYSESQYSEPHYNDNAYGKSAYSDSLYSEDLGYKRQQGVNVSPVSGGYSDGYSDGYTVNSDADARYSQPVNNDLRTQYPNSDYNDDGSYGYHDTPDDDPFGILDPRGHSKEEHYDDYRNSQSSRRKSQSKKQSNSNGKKSNKSGKTSKYDDGYTNRRDSKLFEEDDEVDPKMEKIMSGLMILAAVVVLGVAIFVVANVLGKIKPSVKEGYTTVPSVVGMTIEEASNVLRDSKLTAKASYQNSSEYAKNLICEQDLEEGTEVEEGTVLNLVVSNGFVPDVSIESEGQSSEAQATPSVGGVTVPDVVGKTEAEAKVAIEKEELTMVKEYKESETVEKGVVISQSPLGANTVQAGSSVTVVVSSGTTSVEIKVPDVVGKDEALAKQILVSAGLTCNSTSSVNNNTVAAGNVISQSVSAGSSVKEGTNVDITVSLGPVGYSCSYSISSPADYLSGTEAIITLTDSNGSEIQRFSTTSFPYSMVKTGIVGSTSGYVTVTYQMNDGQWNTTTPVAVTFTQD